MIPTLSFDHFAGVRVFVLLDLTSATWFFFSCCWGSCATIGLGVKQVDDIPQAEAVLAQQITKLFFEFNFFLQLSILEERSASIRSPGEYRWSMCPGFRY